MPHQLEARVSEQVTDILPRAGIEIVDAEDLVSFVEKSFAKVRTDEARTAGDQNPQKRTPLSDPKLRDCIACDRSLRQGKSVGRNGTSHPERGSGRGKSYVPKDLNALLGTVRKKLLVEQLSLALAEPRYRDLNLTRGRTRSTLLWREKGFSLFDFLSEAHALALTTILTKEWLGLAGIGRCFAALSPNGASRTRAAPALIQAPAHAPTPGGSNIGDRQMIVNWRHSPLAALSPMPSTAPKRPTPTHGIDQHYAAAPY
jgi:hypothetical protein